MVATGARPTEEALETVLDAIHCACEDAHRLGVAITGLFDVTSLQRPSKAQVTRAEPATRSP